MATAKAKEARRLEYLPLTALRENIRNPRTHDEGTIDASVGRFGYLEPIIRDERTGLIVAGHGRKKVLTEMKERGEAVPEGCRLAPDGEDWLVPVVVGWASRTDNEAAAALITLNRTTELGGWVDEALLELLDDLDVVDGGLDGVGFGDGDITQLRERLDALNQQEFLGDLTDGATNTFSRSGTWGGDDSVGLTFPMTKEERTAALAVLAIHQSKKGLETRTLALLDILGVALDTEPATEPATASA